MLCLQIAASGLLSLVKSTCLVNFALQGFQIEYSFLIHRFDGIPTRPYHLCVCLSIVIIKLCSFLFSSSGNDNVYSS